MSDADLVLSVVPAKNDRDIAADLRKRAETLLAPMVELMNEAAREGMQMGWAIQRDQFGKFRLVEFSIVKPL